MKKAVSLALVLALVASLSLCAYGKAGDYEEAVALMEAENYEEAVAIFLELGDYEDSAEMVLDCQYRIAVNTFNSEDYATAMNLFAALGDYSDAEEYRLEAAWKALHAYIEEHGENLESTTKLSYVNKSGNGQIIQTNLATVLSNPEQLILYNGNKIEVMGIMSFSDLAITITRGNPEAQFQISTKMTGLGKDIESNVSGDGTFNISSATVNTRLNPSNYLYFYTDIYGQSHSETEMDSTDRAALQESYANVIEGVSAILQQTDLGITLADIGFKAMG